MKKNTIYYEFKPVPGEFPKGRMMHLQLTLTKKAKLPYVPPAEFLGLVFNLGPKVQYSKGSPETSTFRKGHYNMVYAPEGAADLELLKGRYDFFFVEFNAAYLATIFKHFPVLDEFLARINSRMAVLMCDSHPQITPSMFDCMHHVLECSFEGALRDQYLNTKFSQLMLLALDDCKKFVSGASEEEIVKIRELNTYIQQNLKFHLDADFLADKISTTRRKLENGFKQVYGTTVYDYVLTAKMEKAKELLLTTAMPIRDIAVAVGYKSPSNFAKVFKKKCGHSPGELRKNGVGQHPNFRNS